jgi:RNA polymerase sigma-70 factor (ECF subfamily)
MRAGFLLGRPHPLALAERLPGMTLTMNPMTVPDEFTGLLARLRPRLHRYCARMAGSALDGEDIVQEALAKAALHYDAAVVREPERWLFRIAHNAALDFLRRRAFERSLFTEADAQDIAVPEAAADPHAAAEATAAALATFMHLPLAQRSAVILADVLEHALEEIAALLETSVPAVKAALHRGRTRLRELGRQAEPAAAALSAEHRELAQLYAQRFNARDFDGLRALLAEEVRLQLAGRADLQGKAQVSAYFGNYAKVTGLRAVPASIEGRPGVWVHEDGAREPAYAIALEWRDARLVGIRDFRYARYVTEPLRDSAALRDTAGT